MKLLIVTGIFPPDIGGPASYARAVAEKLSGEHSITIVTYSSPFSVADDRQRPYKVVRVWKNWPWLFRHVVFFFKVFRAIRTHDRILALNAIGAGSATALAARFFKKKFFVRIAGDYAWETAVHSRRTPLLLDDFQKIPHRGWIGFLHRMQVWVSRNAAHVIVPSEYLGSIVAGWGINQEKIAVVYNGVDFQPVVLSKEEARKQIGIHGTIILSAGRMVPWKGFRMLIKIMPQLLLINQFFRLVIVGDGPDRSILESMIHNMGLDRKVFIVGRKSQKELAVFLAAADLFILNSGYEGFSHQILEAMKSEVPVVASAVGGNFEVIRQGENGFLVRYNDEFNLIEAVKTLWNMPELRDRFVIEGKNTVERFSFETMLRETKKLLLL